MAGVLLLLSLVCLVTGIAFTRRWSLAGRRAWAFSAIALCLLSIATQLAWQVSHGVPSGFHRSWGDQGFPVYDSPGQGTVIAVAHFAVGVLSMGMAFRWLRRTRTEGGHPPGAGEERWFAIAWVTVATWVVVHAAYVMVAMIRGEPVRWYGPGSGDDSMGQALVQLTMCLVVGFLYYVAMQMLRRERAHHRQ